ncbi:MAG: magnesium transporter [Clostridia bacterium]|nr:magnesium transporter [Clostridia bacterium]
MKKNEKIELNVAAQLPDYKEEIIGILRGNKNPKLMREEILSYHENDIAAAMELLSKDERIRLYNILDIDTLAASLAYTEQLNEYLTELPARKRVAALSKMELPVIVEALRELSKPDRSMLIELMDEELRQEVRLLASFDEEEIGSKMTTNYISIPNGIGVRDAMRSLIGQAAENDNISTLYVVEEGDIFYGAIDLKDLIIARESTPIEDIITTYYPYVYADEPIEECIDRIKDYSEDSIPVLDSENRLCGVLTSAIIGQLRGDELEDDYAKLAGLTAEEDLQEPLKKSIGKRLPWLMILLVLGLLVSGVVGIFEPVAAELPLIVSFQSLVLGMAGNAGTQSLAVTIRVLTDEQISGKQKLFFIFKESRVGLINGLILAILSCGLIGGYLTLFRQQSPTFAFATSGCIALALILSITVSALFGTAIPMLFKKLKIDPAVASGPLITTVNDLVAVVSYYGLAWVLLLNLA